jgi:hypothetical protein
LLCSFYFTNADSVRSFWTFADFEVDGVPVLNFSFYFGDVYEKVVSAFSFNESVSFCLVKPLYCTLCHDSCFNQWYIILSAEPPLKTRFLRDCYLNGKRLKYDELIIQQLQRSMCLNTTVGWESLSSNLILKRCVRDYFQMLMGHGCFTMSSRVKVSIGLK